MRKSYTIVSKDQDEILRAAAADDAFALIYDIDQRCRAILKYGWDEKKKPEKVLEETLEELREMIFNSRLMEYYV